MYSLWPPLLTCRETARPLGSGSPTPDQTRVRSGLSGHNPDLTRGMSASPKVY